nr:serine/arginine repetitive matrix protein 1-like [Microcebus murinus]
MLKMAKKFKARVSDSERRTAAAVADVAAEAAVAAAALAEPREPLARKPPTPPKSLAREDPSRKFLSEKERKKLEKKLLEQQKKEEKKREKERKKLEKMLKKSKKVPEAPEPPRGPMAAGAAVEEDEGAAAGEGAAGGGTSRAWAQWETDEDDEDDDYYALPRVGGIVWRPRAFKSGVLSAHLPLVVFLIFSVRSPSWVLSFLLQRRTERGRGCGFVFGATCCFRMFLGCAFFSFWSTRAKRRGLGYGRSGARGAFGPGYGARRRGRGDDRFM